MHVRQIFKKYVNLMGEFFQSPVVKKKFKLWMLRSITVAIVLFVVLMDEASAQENNDFNSDFSNAEADGTYFKTMMDNAWTVIKGGTYVGGTGLMANGFWKLKNAKDDWHSPVIGGGLMMALIPGIKFAKSLFSGNGITKLVDND